MLHHIQDDDYTNAVCYLGMCNYINEYTHYFQQSVSLIHYLKSSYLTSLWNLVNSILVSLTKLVEIILRLLTSTVNRSFVSFGRGIRQLKSPCNFHVISRKHYVLSMMDPLCSLTMFSPCSVHGPSLQREHKPSDCLQQMVSATDKTFTVAVRGKEIRQNWVFVTNYYVQQLDRSVERLSSLWEGGKELHLHDRVLKKGSFWRFQSKKPANLACRRHQDRQQTQTSPAQTQCRISRALSLPFHSSPFTYRSNLANILHRLSMSCITTKSTG